MIDRTGRNRYAELLRQFCSGRMTNRRYEEATWRILDESRPEDLAIVEVYGMAWFLYCDLRTHRLQERWRLTPEGRREVARWIVFLHSDLEYRWPVLPVWRRLLPPLLLLAWPVTAPLAAVIVWIRDRLRPIPALDTNGSLWPFFDEAEYRAALRYPRLLAGPFRRSPRSGAPLGS